MPAASHDLGPTLETYAALAVNRIADLEGSPVVVLSIGRLIVVVGHVPQFADRVVGYGMAHCSSLEVTAVGLSLTHSSHDLVYSPLLPGPPGTVTGTRYNHHQQKNPSQHCRNNDGYVDSWEFCSEAGHFHQHSVGVLCAHVHHLVSAVNPQKLSTVSVKN